MFSRIVKASRSPSTRTVIKNIRNLSSKTNGPKQAAKVKPSNVSKDAGEVSSKASSSAKPNDTPAVAQNPPVEKKGMGKVMKLILGIAFGVPVGVLGGMKLSPDFFYRCEHDFPRAVSYIRHHLPLGWPDPELSNSSEADLPEDDGPITVTLKEEELQKELVELIHTVEKESGEETLDIPRILQAIAAARAMLEEEKKRLESDVCEIDQSTFWQEVKEGTEEEKREEEEEEEKEWDLFKYEKAQEDGEWGAEEEEEEVVTTETKEEKKAVEEAEEVKAVEEVPKQQEEQEEDEEAEEWHVLEENKVSEGEWGSEEAVDDEEEEIIEVRDAVQPPVKVEDRVVKIVIEDEPDDEEWHIMDSRRVKEGEWGSEEEEMEGEYQPFKLLAKQLDKEEKELEDAMKQLQSKRTGERSEEEYISIEDLKEEDHNEPKEELKEEVVEEIKEEIEEEVEDEIKEDIPEKVQEEVKEEVEEVSEEKAPLSEATNKQIAVETMPEQPSIPSPDAEIDWEYVSRLVADARSRLLKPSESAPSLPHEIESAITQQINELTSQLDGLYHSQLTDELSQRIELLQQQLRNNSVQESYRLYLLLKQQREDLIPSFESKLQDLESSYRHEIGEQMETEKKQEISAFLKHYKSEIDRMQKMYIGYIDDYVYAKEMAMRGRLLAEEIKLNERWQQRIVEETAQVKKEIREEQMKRFEEFDALQKELQNVIQQMKLQEIVLSDMMMTEEYQRVILEMQEHIMKNISIRDDLNRLKEKARNDPILVHLINKVPQSVVDQRVPGILYYYSKFEEIRQDARAASKTPEGSGFAGELLGRTVAAFVGKEGVSEDDPLMKLEKMRSLLMSNDLEGAYQVGCSIEGPAREVIGDWMKEVEERLEFSRTIQQIKMHVELGEMSRKWTCFLNKQYILHIIIIEEN